MDGDTTPAFADYLRACRQRAGLTQDALAARAGVSARNIQNLERARNRPLADTTARLIAALGLDAAEGASFRALATASPRRHTPSDPPTMVSAPALPTSRLPLPPTSFLGRVREMALVRDLLAGGARLVSLTGVGGTGKTRLALEVARDAGERGAAAVIFVDLTATSDAALVPLLIAQALDVRAVSGRSVTAALVAALREREALLVLDNYEHVLAAAPLVGTLLAAAPRLTVLATSRSALRLSGEHEVRVAPLDTPERGAWTLDELRDYAVVQLFLQRARAARPSLVLTDDDAADVAEICRRLDGLPLAIELAAARLKLFSPRHVRERLDQRFALLVGGPRDLPARQQALRGLLDWSYTLLTPRERRLFARLGVFAGSWDLDGAAAVYDREDAAGPEEVEALADAGLLEYVVDGPTAPRFRMLETIRDYALARLAESGEADDVRRVHARSYVALAEAATPHLRGPAQVAWTRRLDAEQGNVRAALEWLLRDDVTGALRLAAALERYWIRGRSLAEGRRWLEAALARAEGPTPVRARALVAAGPLVADMGDLDRAEDLLREARASYEAAGDAAGRARALVGLGGVAFQRNDHARAHGLLGEALALYRQRSDRWGLADTLFRVGMISLASYVADTHQRTLSGTGGSPASRTVSGPAPYTLTQLAGILGESHALFGLEGDRWGAAVTLSCLGTLAFLRGEHNQAYALTIEALTPLRDLGDTAMIARMLQALALIAGARGEPRRGVRLFAAAETLFAVVGVPWPAAHRSDMDGRLAVLRAPLSEDDFAAAWAEGAVMTVDAAIQEATGEHAHHKDRPLAPACYPQGDS